MEQVIKAKTEFCVGFLVWLHDIKPTVLVTGISRVGEMTPLFYM